MSKYNNMKSIPISSLSKEELKQAVNEWAEGNSHMEKLLWSCMDNGIETCGSHAEGAPYIEFRVNNAHEKLKNMMNSVQTVDGVQILVLSDGENLFSGLEFYKPSISIGFLKTYSKEEVGKVLDMLTDSLKDLPKESVFDGMLDFYDFFAEKGTGVNIRAGYEDGQYSLSLESTIKRNFSECNRVFQKAGLELKKDDNIPIDIWTFIESSPEEFKSKMKSCLNVIKQELSLEVPNEITDDMQDNEQARIKRRMLGDTPEGKAEFARWLEMKKRERVYISECIQKEQKPPKTQEEIDKWMKKRREEFAELEASRESEDKAKAFRSKYNAGISLEEQRENAEAIKKQSQRQDSNPQPSIEEK